MSLIGTPYSTVHVHPKLFDCNMQADVEYVVYCMLISREYVVNLAWPLS